ncbi:MAG TPA: GAF domain-containing protein [Armatimonadota bacterium]
MPAEELYAALAPQVEALLGDETDFIANAANLAAAVYHALPDPNWAGFYIRRGEELVLGPFQGKPACVRIPMGKGICGTAAARQETLIVADVHAFPGHIACDAASRSEIVVPMIVDGKCVGVLDLDSPAPGRFTHVDARGLEHLVKLLLRRSSPLVA